MLCERIQSTNQPCTLRVRDIVELDQTLQKCNTESLFERPLPLLNSFLSPNKIPNGAQTSNGDEAVQTSIVCLGALANVRAHFGKGWATLVPTLMVFWPNIYKWLEYLYYRFIRNGESESTAHRDTALFTIIGISRLHAEDKSLLALISHIPGFMEILVNSWIFSAQKRIDSGTEPVSATLYRYLNYLQLQEPVEHKDMFNEERCLGWVHLPQNVCDSADERAGLFARAALAHLVIDTEQQYLEGTVGDVNLFELISRGPAWPAARLHLRMLSKGSATWVSNTAASITRSTWPQSEFSVAVGCVSSCYKYLMTLEFIMAETWICKAIKGHLFNALFKTNTWLEDMDGDVREKFYDPIRTMCLHLLNNILPKYLICRSVLQISREELLGREFSREMANYTTLSGPLANGLLSFVALVEERWTIDKHLEDTYHRKFICHNPSVRPSHLHIMTLIFIYFWLVRQDRPRARFQQMCEVPAGVVLFPELSERALDSRAWAQSHLSSDQANYKPSLYVLTAIIFEFQF